MVDDRTRSLSGIPEWLAVAASQVTTTDLDLSALPEVDLQRFASDLSDFVEALIDCQQRITVALSGAPTSDALETALVEAEIDLELAQRRFRQMTELLRSHDMWMEDDPDLS